MTEELCVDSPREQQDLPGHPYDRWISPAGQVSAEFHRTRNGYRIRFPGQADFLVSADLQDISCVPTPQASHDLVETLYANSVLPLLGNHSGKLTLHGSACMLPGGAVGFVGHSRRGKTTLAAACAKAGHPFLSEDVISLATTPNGYDVQPMRPVLRVFGDTANFVRGDDAGPTDKAKVTLDAGPGLPFADKAALLQAIYVLGPGTAPDMEITTMGPGNALAEIMQHAFILDVEDKQQLAAHFDRLSRLALEVPFIMLDYPRRFEHLPVVVERLAAHAAAIGAGKE